MPSSPCVSKVLFQDDYLAPGAWTNMPHSPSAAARKGNRKTVFHTNQKLLFWRPPPPPPPPQGAASPLKWPQDQWSIYYYTQLCRSTAQCQFLRISDQILGEFLSCRITLLFTKSTLDVSNSPNTAIPGFYKSYHTVGMFSAYAGLLLKTVKQASRPQAILKLPAICLDYRACNRHQLKVR